MSEETVTRAAVVTGGSRGIGRHQIFYAVQTSCQDPFFIFHDHA